MFSPRKDGTEFPHLEKTVQNFHKANKRNASEKYHFFISGNFYNIAIFACQKKSKQTKAMTTSLDDVIGTKLQNEMVLCRLDMARPFLM